MTDRQFLERMIFLTKKLCDVTNEDGYGSDSYFAVLDEIREMGTSFNRSHRRQPWGIIFFCLFLLYCLAWLVWTILF